jgi:hypothetical protein
MSSEGLILIAGNLTSAFGYAGLASRGDRAPGQIATVFAIGECVHAVVLGPLVAAAIGAGFLLSGDRIPEPFAATASNAPGDPTPEAA